MARDDDGDRVLAQGVADGTLSLGMSDPLGDVRNPTGMADDADDEMVLINPKIKRRKKLEYGEEGCLSFPGIYAEVERHHEITVEYQNPTGEQKEEQLDGFLARIILHEVDHLQGVLFVDRLSPAERIRVRSKLAELEKRFKDEA